MQSPFSSEQGKANCPGTLPLQPFLYAVRGVAEAASEAPQGGECLNDCG